MSEQAIFQVNNHHHDSAGRPPHLDDTTPNQYRGYFENEYGQPVGESSTWVTVVGRHHMKYATVKLLASIFHPWNSHGCDFVGRQQHGQSTNTMKTSVLTTWHINS